MTKANLLAKYDQVITKLTESLAIAQESRRIVEAWPDDIVPTVPPTEPTLPDGWPNIVPVTQGYGISLTTYPHSRYKIREVRHLPPEENKGKHNVYIDVYNTSGNRVSNVLAIAQHDEKSRSFYLDKRQGEPMGNTPIYPGERLSVCIDAGFRDTSDVVHGLHTNHPTELGPSGEIWNSYGHHSFYLRFEMVG